MPTTRIDEQPRVTPKLRQFACQEFPRAKFAYLLMLASAVAFSSMSASAVGLKGRVDWRAVAVARSSLAFLFTFSIARALGVRLVWPGPKTLWVRSLTGSMGMLCTFFALSHLAISESVTLLNTFPLWVAVLSWPVLGLRPTVGVWVAIGVGMAGIVVIAINRDEEAALLTHRELAMVLALLAAFSTSVVMMGLNRLRHLDPFAIAVHFAFISTLACAGYAVFTSYGEPLRLDGLSQPVTWLLLLGVGGFATLGQLLMTTAFQHGPPDRLATIGLTQTVFALGYDLLFWGHSLNGPLVVGVVLVSAPAAWLVARRRR